MIGGVLAARAAFVLLVAALILVDRARGTRYARVALTGIAALAIVALIVVCADHVPFAGQLETMEATVLQHAVRAAHGQAVYPAPTPAYVPLAYNPGYYYLAAPFIWLLGPSLPTLRIVAVVGLLGSAILIYAAVRRHTDSRWWGLIAVGLFAAAYRVMDSALDNAHSDSWLLCAALLGAYLIDRNKSRGAAMLGTLACVASFWFKQHGAVFAVGVVLYLTWRDGPRQSWPYWLIAFVGGPLLYLACAQVPFGPYFHYYTYTVPSGWSQPRLGMMTRLATYFGSAYLVLGVGAILGAVVAFRHRGRRLTVWHALLPCALLTAVQGTLDPGSSNNVFIASGAWLIIVGTMGLADAVSRLPATREPAARAGADWRLAAVATAFACLFYNPAAEMLSPRAAASYADLTQMVRGLDAPVYAPDIGQSAGAPLFTPGVNWVALDDMSRGPHRTAADQARALAPLDPVLHPVGRTFVLTYGPLDQMRPPVRFLHDRYTLVTTFGDRFRDLRGPPKFYGSGWPRMLYRFDPAVVSAAR